MSDEDRNRKPPTLEELAARGAALQGKPAWKPSQGFRDAMAEIERLDALPEPPAPEPVVVLPEHGEVVVTDTEAAEAYVGPTVVKTALSPRMPTGPVKIRSDVDPRRQPTLPSVRASGSTATTDKAAGRGANAEDDAEDAPGAQAVHADAASAGTNEVAPAHTIPIAAPREASPSSHATRKAPGGTAKAAGSGDRVDVRRAAAIVLAAAVAAIVVVLLFRPGAAPQRGSGTGGTDTGGTNAPSGSTATSSTGAASETSAPAATPSASSAEVPSVTTAASATPSTAPSVTAAASAKPAPSVNPDPYIDAGGPPKPASTPSAAPSSVPSSAPSSVATAAPSVVPAATAAPSATVAPSSRPAASGTPTFWFPPKKSP